MSSGFIFSKLIVRSRLTQLRSRFGSIQADFGSTHQVWPVESSLKYIHSCFDDYVEYGHLRKFEGLEVLEGGPGDNFGVGALMLAHGARRYVGVDAFFSKQDGVQQQRIYTALRAGLSAEQQARFDQAIDLSTGVGFNEDRLKPIYGPGMGDFERLFAPSSFDLIISRAVVEQVDNVAGVFRGMDRVLKPGGLLLHKIDLSDYGNFSRHGHHPLTQLTLSDLLYDNLLAPNSGQMNRWTLADYRKQMEQMGYQAELFITSVIRDGYPQREIKPHILALRQGVDYGDKELGMVRSIRPRLNRRFRLMADEDLIAAGVFLSARKPS